MGQGWLRREGGGGGRYVEWGEGVSKGGGGLAGTPLLAGSLYGPRRRRAQHFEA